MNGLRSLLLIACLLSAPLSAPAQESGQSFSVRATAITDGDTFDARRSDGQTMTVRLYGVDAPESNQPYGDEARAAARRYIGGERVRVTVEDTGPYGRTIGSVEVHGGSLAEMLARDGLAWHAERYAPDATEIARLERQARNANRGLWSQPTPIPPWDWRDGERGATSSPSASSSGLPYDPSGPDRDCNHFNTHDIAQRFFEVAGPGDPHRLDGDGDGVACEELQ